MTVGVQFSWIIDKNWCTAETSQNIYINAYDHYTINGEILTNGTETNKATMYYTPWRSSTEMT